MKLQLWTVYDGGRREHYTSAELFGLGGELEPLNQSVLDRRPNWRRGIISDRAAQTVASWWHSPANAYSTLLSTRGLVDRYTTLDDFGDPKQPGLSDDDKRALTALGEYILDRQQRAESAYRPCACHDCMDVVVGLPGELCSECKDARCEAQYMAECQRGDAYVGFDPCCRHCEDDDECDGDHDPFCGHCEDGCC